MKLKIEKLEQGPVMAQKGDVDVGGAAGAGPVVIDTGDGGKIGGPINKSGNAGVGYECNF